MAKRIEEALTKINNRFLLTTVVARRWENIVVGAPALVDTHKGQSKVEVVLEEIVHDRVHVDTVTRQISLSGQPEIEINEEPLFSEALTPESDGGRAKKGDR